ncbi:MAG: MerR family transcriptional regulator [Chloroflexota bacterium]
MFIKALSQRTGVSTKTIRYYESIGLMKPPERADNNYRVYPPEAVERLRFIVAARSLDFNLTDIAQFLEAQDDEQLPCHRILASLKERIVEIDRRLADLLALRDTLTAIQAEAKNLPADAECNADCVCNLLAVSQKDGQVVIKGEN